MNELEKKIKEKLESHIETVFIELQNEMGIKSGDISPYDALELGYVMKELTSRMAIILLKQK